jgi:hypothetical protein
MDAVLRSSSPSDAGFAALGELRRTVRDDGGFPERAGGGFSPGATAWAALVLARVPGSSALALRAAERLAQAQLPDGRVAVAAGHADAVWPTPLALLAWQATGSHPEHRDRAERFLLATAGVGVGEDSANRDIAGHDTTIPGWPWILGTHSWVEPTALAVLALRRAGRTTHQRVQDGVRLLVNRQLSRGGWNYGNTTVYGTELVPQVDATGVALAALAGMIPTEAVAKSIAMLENAVPAVKTPLSLAWALFGLSLWGRRPAGAANWIDKSFSLAGQYGGYSTTHLAMLLAAQDAGGAFFS